MSVLLEKIMDEVDHQKEVATSLESNIAALLSDDTLWHLWTVTSRDATGRLEGELFGNGVNTKRIYDHFTGDLLRIKSGVAEKLIRDIQYTYNAKNSVMSRRDALNNVNETFTYDALDRLTNWNYTHPKAANIARQYRYDTRGNMTLKTNAGNMTYDGGNRLTSRTYKGKKVTYSYDKNGNMLKGDGRTYNWTAFNKASSVITAKGATHYTYGGGQSRVKKEVNGVTTYYFGRDYEVTVEKVKGKTVRTMRHHIFAGHELVATHKKVLNDGMKQTDTTAYVHRDALGSVDTVTNQVAEIIQQQRYSPFGESLPVAGAKNQFAARDIRGYTSHENVGDTGLINMNARLYDPLIGRFIQADTMIPDASSAQDYNRYAYVRNNPMKYSDPSGHFPFLLGLGLFLFSMTTDDPFLQKVTGLAGNIIMGGALFGLGFSAVANGATLSFIGGTAQGGFDEGIKQGIIGGVTAGLTFGLAEQIGHGYTPKAVVGQMVLQRAIGEINGGKFKHGAISALAGKVGSHYGQSYFGAIGTGTEGDRFGRAAVSAMFGGLASEATGGSFEDGAMNALFVHLFNDEAGYRLCTKYDAGTTPCSPSRYSGRTGSMTGENEAGLRNDDINISVGASAEATFMLPVVGGGTIGFNQQIGGGVTGIYLYLPVLSEYDDAGFSVGGNFEVNIAKGEGGWTGLFLNDFASVGPISGSYFSSPDGSWRGVSGGVGLGAPVGVGSNTTNYHKINVLPFLLTVLPAII